MRVAVIVGLALVGAASQADAFDFGPLRGSMLDVSGSANWSGAYAGAQAGYSNAGMNFGTAPSPLVDFLMRNTSTGSILGMSDWTVLGTANTSGTSFGGFVGYNFQFDEAVVGLEVNYNRTSLSSTGSDSMSRFTGGPIETRDPITNVLISRTGERHDGLVAGTASLTLTDYGTFRLRGGYAIGQFMPYGFVAAAVGRVNYAVTAQVASRVTQYTMGADIVTNYNPAPLTESADGAFIYGGAVGLGFDMMLAGNLFVRGEWEYLQFQEFHGMRLNVNSARVAAGVKF